MQLLHFLLHVDYFIGYCSHHQHAHLCVQQSNQCTSSIVMFVLQDFRYQFTIKMLGNAGVCVSGETVKRLKVWISEDAIHLAIELIKSSTPLL